MASTTAPRRFPSLVTGACADDGTRSRHYGVLIKALFDVDNQSLSTESIHDCLRRTLPGGVLTEDLVAALLHVAQIEALEIMLADVYDGQLWVAIAHPAAAEYQRRRVSGSGVGVTALSALLRCLFELSESLCAIGHTRLTLIRSSEAALGAAAISRESLRKISARQYRQAGMPTPACADEEIDWIAVTTLSAAATPQQRFVAAENVFLDPAPPSEQYCWRADSTGCAAARDVDEATTRGLLELIERDAAAVWWYNALPRPLLDWRSLLDSAPGSAAAETLGVATWCQTLAHHFFVLDLTHDIGVPVYCAVSADEDGGHVALGIGCHMDPIAALNHACRELVQQKIKLKSVRALASTTPPALQLEQSVARWLSEVHVDRCPQLKPDRGLSTLPEVMRQPDDSDAITLRQQLVERLAKNGVDCYCVDLTDPDYGVPAVRCIAPRLRNIQPCFAPGRLFDVPLALGWSKTPTSETSMAHLVALV